MNIEQTPLPGLLVLEPRRFADDRGWFAESWNARTLSAYGLDLEFVQDNHSLSTRVGTVRGLHFQAPPHAQGKLVRCGRGRLWDVAVDIRAGSPTFGAWFGIELSAGNGKQLLVPAGFAHGFVTREPDTEIVYKCTAPYAPAAERALAWNDPAIGIEWSIEGEPTVSTKDAAAPTLDALASPFVWEESP